jgi:hypothetical protein
LRAIHVCMFASARRSRAIIGQTAKDAGKKPGACLD